jgi:membrane protein implicated in regulation of membrane protease activity
MSGIDSDHLAQAQGVLGLVALIAAPLGQAIFLTLINAFGAPLAWTTFAVSSFVLVLAVWFLARRVHEPQLVDEK